MIKSFREIKSKYPHTISLAIKPFHPHLLTQQQWHHKAIFDIIRLWVVKIPMKPLEEFCWNQFSIKDIHGPFHLKSTPPPLLLRRCCEFHPLRSWRSEYRHFCLFTQSLKFNSTFRRWGLFSTPFRNRVLTCWPHWKCSSDPPPQISSTGGVDFTWNGLVWFTYLRFAKLTIFREVKNS